MTGCAFAYRQLWKEVPMLLMVGRYANESGNAVEPASCNNLFTWEFGIAGTRTICGRCIDFTKGFHADTEIMQRGFETRIGFRRQAGEDIGLVDSFFRVHDMQLLYAGQH
jgi:hypothetical protein